MKAKKKKKKFVLFKINFKKKKKLKEENISYFCQSMCGLKISLPGISFTISFMHFITTKHLHITENGV